MLCRPKGPKLCSQTWEAGIGVNCLAGTLKCVTHPPWETLSTVISALGTSLHSKDILRLQQGIIYSKELFRGPSQPEADSTRPEGCHVLVL